MGYSLSFDPAILMPYKEILGSSTGISIVGNTIQCSDVRENLKTCAEDCFTKNNNRENCVGLLSNATTCLLCEVLDQISINSGASTNFRSDDKLYLLQSPTIDPDIHISMDDFDLITGDIRGTGVTGTSSGIMASDLVSHGKVGQAIYVHDGARMFLSVPQPECFCNFDYCNGTISASFWVRSYGTSSRLQSIIRPFQVDNGLIIRIAKNTHELQGVFYWPGKKLSYESNSGLLSDWTFVVITVDTNVGLTIYINGTKDTFKSITQAGDSSNYQSTCRQLVVGIKTPSVLNPANSDLDELMYFYRALSDTGKLTKVLKS